MERILLLEYEHTDMQVDPICPGYQESQEASG